MAVQALGAAWILLCVLSPLVSGDEDCLWYQDQSGSWHPGFDCHLFTFCCGNCHQRFCCRDPMRLITEREQKHCLALSPGDPDVGDAPPASIPCPDSIPYRPQVWSPATLPRICTCGNVPWQWPLHSVPYVSPRTPHVQPQRPPSVCASPLSNTAQPLSVAEHMTAAPRSHTFQFHEFVAWWLS
ncbi:protein shisa-4 isoform X2 [Ascaphus truei]|uniref:protein shisa-4 isoform X2 n=1 Tax=Ascaphus truei TaxID=8439 RepID=UPI003F5A3FF3